MFWKEQKTVERKEIQHPMYYIKICANPDVEEKSEHLGKYFAVFK